MRPPFASFTLPKLLSLLLFFLFLVPQCFGDLQWPYDLPPHVKYYPEDEPQVRRIAKIQNHLANHTPNSLRKMSSDEGQMFFLEYWSFEGHESRSKPKIGNEQLPDESQKGFDGLRNTSQTYLPQPALLLHADGLPAILNRFLRNPLQKRDFSCPMNTTSCTAINRPNSCCSDGLQCNIIPDTGFGDVGCCADSSCSGQVTGCQEGYTSCPASQGGGCCIPGYACNGVGCVLATTTVIVIHPTITLTSTSSPTTSTVSKAFTTTHTSPTSTFSSISIATSTIACSSGFRSCPASLGGGCCATERLCGSQSCPAATISTSVSIGAPVRPTSATLVTTSEPAPITATACPTGFYQCSAYYNGGACCQVGRDCGLTSCPPHETSSVLVSNGVTVLVAPTGSVTNNGSGVQENCANGWYSCNGDVGGGCCPSGYGCGALSCTAVASATATPTTVPKENRASNPGTCNGVVTLVFGVLVSLFPWWHIPYTRNM